MMLTWSPHSGDRPDTSPKIAVDYMLNSAVRKTIAEQPLSLQRDPQPELLLGDKDIFPLGLNALPFKHRYNFATLSFHEQDISVSAFNAGDPNSRQKIAQTLKLFFEIAWAGVPVSARMQPLVGTHTHTGRLEVNIMMARGIRNENGHWRSYNAHFPRMGSSEIWDFFTDYVNLRFRWADPRAPERRKLVRLSNKILKQKAEAERLGKPFDISVLEQTVALAEDLIKQGGIKDRKYLIASMKPGLDTMGINVVQSRKNDVVFLERSTHRKWALSGLCFSQEFSPGAQFMRVYLQEPGVDPDWPAAIRRCRRQRITSLRELIHSYEERATYNSRRYGFSKRPDPDFWQILRQQPGIDLPISHPRITGGYLDGYAQPAGIEAHTADRAVSSSAKQPDSASRGSRGTTRGRARRADDHAEFIRRAENPFELFVNLGRRLARIMSNLRRRQAGRILAKAMREHFLQRWQNIGNRLETLNDGTLTPNRMASAFGRTAQADGIDRAATGIAGAGRGAGPFGPDRPLSGRDHPGGRSGGTGGNSNGGRGPEPRSDATNHKESGRAETPDRQVAGQDGTNSGRVGRTTGRQRLTRAELICRARQIAQDEGIEAPRLSFVRDEDQERLRMAFGTTVIMVNGDGNLVQDVGVSEPDLP